MCSRFTTLLLHMFCWSVLVSFSFFLSLLFWGGWVGGGVVVAFAFVVVVVV